MPRVEAKEGGAWLSPTQLNRLLACAASVSSTSDPHRLAFPAEAQNIGSLAHVALEKWVRGDEWLSDESGNLLRERYVGEGVRNGVAVNSVSGGRLLGVRLKQLAGQLREVLRSTNLTHIEVETPIKDEHLRIWGIPDLLTVADGTVNIYDYKTGRQILSGSQLAESTLIQLAVYEMLGRVRYPDLEVKSFVISPSSGVVAAGDLADLKGKIAELVDKYRTDEAAGSTPVATPQAAACQYCPKRLYCEPHWAEDLDELAHDRVEGAILDSRVDRSGRVSFAVQTSKGRRWVLGVDEAALRGTKWTNARALRAVRLLPGDTNSEETVHLRATSRSTVLCR